MRELRSHLGRYQPDRIDTEAQTRAGWRRHGILVIAEQDPCLSWPERELVRQLVARLYGLRQDTPDAERPASAQRGLKDPTNRTDASTMITPHFFAWLDAKMAALGNGKLVSPAAVLEDGLSETLEHRLHRQITEQILCDTRIETRVAAVLGGIDVPRPEDVHVAIGGALLDHPAASCRAAIERVADRLLEAQDHAGAAPEAGA
jgi:hypothetical protein